MPGDEHPCGLTSPKYTRSMPSQDDARLDSRRPGVLVVDDLPSNRRMLARTLSTLDVEVLEAGSGTEALDIVAREDHLFVILLDVRMPGMDGYTLAETLRQMPKAATLPIIFVSAHDSDTYHHHRAYETGAVDFLSKPVSPRILLSKVKVFLDLYQQRSELEDFVTRLDAVNHALSRQTVRLETSAEVIHQVASILDVDRLLFEIVTLIRERFGYDYLGVWTLRPGPEGDSVVLHAGQYGTDTPILEPGSVIDLAAPLSIIAHVCRTGVTYLCNDTYADPRYLPAEGLEAIRSELTLPLRFGDTLIGALDIQSEALDAFAAEDVAAFTTLADQIAVAIRNARLYAEVTHLNDDLEAMVEERTRELARAYRNLELLDRNKTDFITVVSHELRTPLTLIHGYSQMLAMDPLVSGDQLRSREVHGIVTGAERLSNIINAMLDIVKIDSATLRLSVRKASLGHLLEAAVARLGPVLRDRSLAVVTDGVDALPEITADPDALDKVFQELLSNAVKYTPDGGTITISGHLIEADGRENTPYLEVVVQDTGIGIAPESLELIFVKFYSTGDITLHSTGKTKFKGGGPGLGLTVARGIVEAHGGRIWAESPGHDEITLPGSAFHVVLPVESYGPAVPQPSPDRMPDGAPRGRTTPG